MRSLSAQELLDVWEVGQGQIPVERAISLLSAGSPELAEDALVHLPIGERDRQLLMLRERTFGSDLEAVASCPTCGEMLETTVHSADIYRPVGAGLSTDPVLRHGEYSVRFRLPDSQDLAAISGNEVTSEARDLLLERCILGATMGSDPVQFSDLPGGVVEALMGEMEKADPLANNHLSLTCPSCGGSWQEGLDILSFFWDEIENWACRTLHEIHMLALAYGWSEPEILSLSAARRQMYLEKVSE